MISKNFSCIYFHWDTNMMYQKFLFFSMTKLTQEVSWKTKLKNLLPCNPLRFAIRNSFFMNICGFTNVFLHFLRKFVEIFPGKHLNWYVLIYIEKINLSCVIKGAIGTTFFGRQFSLPFIQFLPKNTDVWKDLKWKKHLRCNGWDFGWAAGCRLLQP